jgi:hypothetical protein
MVIEILSYFLKQSKDITGIQINNKEIILTQYADDLTLTLGNANSISPVLDLLQSFGNSSGLYINKDKTVGMLLGSLRGEKPPSKKLKFTEKPIKLLGIRLSNNPKDIVYENFHSKIESLIKQLHWWKARNLSLQGRILIVKSVGLSKFQYLASLLYIPENVIREINSIIYEFVWNGKSDKVKRDILEQNYDKGGQKMINMKDIVKSSLVIWIQKYLDNTDRLWKTSFEHFCKVKNLNIFLRSNFEMSELPKSIPNYYEQAIKYWSEVSNSTNSKSPITSDMYIWYNKLFKIGNKTVYSNTLFKAGIWSILDLYDNNVIIPFEIWLQRGATELDRLLWTGFVHILKQCNYGNKLNPNISCGVTTRDTVICVESLKQKHIKEKLAEAKYSSLNESDLKYKMKANDIYGLISDDEWSQIFGLLKLVNADNKTLELQYKIVMRFVATNNLLYKMKKVNSATCNFCGLEKQTIEHLFFNCTEVRNIWLFVFNKWNICVNSNIAPDVRTCIFGKLQQDHDVESLAVNTLILIVKSYIFKCKYESITPCRVSLIKYVKYQLLLYTKAYNSEAIKLLNVMFEVDLEML